MQKITPHLWFDKEAKESAEFYVSVFPNSKIKSHNVIKGTPEQNKKVTEAFLKMKKFDIAKLEEAYNS